MIKFRDWICNLDPIDITACTLIFLIISVAGIMFGTWEFMGIVIIAFAIVGVIALIAFGIHKTTVYLQSKCKEK